MQTNGIIYDKTRKLFAVLKYKTVKVFSLAPLARIHIFTHSAMPVAYRLHFMYHKVSSDIFIAEKMYYCADKMYNVPTKIRK